MSGSCLLAPLVMAGWLCGSNRPGEAGRPTIDPAIDSIIVEAARRFAICPRLLEAVIMVESGANTFARSPKGAMGLMQIMPATWTWLKPRYHLGDDPYDIHDNVMAGAGMLRDLYDQFGEAGFLAAYHAGPSRYIALMASGQPLSAQTRSYLNKLARLLNPNDPQAILRTPPSQDWRQAPLFARSEPDGNALSSNHP